MSTAIETAAVAVPPSEILITLDFPINDGNQEFTELVMRQPTMGDYLKFKKKYPDALEQDMHLYAAMCSVSPSLIELVRPWDFDKLNAAYAELDPPKPPKAK
jgi:hypothetical protein